MSAPQPHNMKTPRNTHPKVALVPVVMALLSMTISIVRADYQSTVLSDSPLAYYPLSTNVDPTGTTATGIGIINGIGNLVGACAPASIGFIVAGTGSYKAGLLVIVVASVLGSLALLPMVRFKPAA